MYRSSRFQLDQRFEINPRVELAGKFQLSYAFNRAASRQNRAKAGADYLAFKYDDNLLVFAICDGVSQSFNGGFAAKFVADRLIDWLWNEDLTKNLSIIIDDAKRVLQLWTTEATNLVSAFPVNSFDETARDFLERRKQNGAQSMFIVGALDQKSNKATFLSSGDIGLLVETNQLQVTRGEQTFDRWSTLTGVIGDIKPVQISLDIIQRISVYSDGLKQFVDETKLTHLTPEILSKIKSPSDDTTALVICTDRQFRDALYLNPLSINFDRNIIHFSGLSENSWVRILSDDLYLRDAITIDLPPQVTSWDLQKINPDKKGKLLFQQVSATKQPSKPRGLAPNAVGRQYERVRRPVAGSPQHVVPSAPPNTDTPVTTASANHVPLVQPTSPTHHPSWQRVLRLLLGITGWVLALVFFYTLQEKDDQINHYDNIISNYQITIESLRFTPTLTPTITLSPTTNGTNTKAATPTVQSEFTPTANLPKYKRFLTTSSDLPFFLSPDIASSILRYIPVNHVLIVIDDTRLTEGWLLVQDNLNQDSGWINIMNLTENTIFTLSGENK